MNPEKNKNEKKNLILGCLPLLLYSLLLVFQVDLEQFTCSSLLHVGNVIHHLVCE